MRTLRFATLAVAAGLTLFPQPKAAQAEASQVRVSKGYGILYLPLNTRFSATPNGVMNFADFLHRAGTIKVKPASWSELFVPILHGRPGS